MTILRRIGALAARIVLTEPAVVKGVIGYLVAGLLIWGADMTLLGEQLKQTADVVGGLAALLTPFWIRRSVTPTALTDEASKE